MLKLSYTPKEYECTCCGELKPESEFYRQSYTDVRCNECKTCTNVKRSVVRNKARHGKFISSEKRRHMTQDIEYTLQDWKECLIHFAGRCAFCGEPEGRSKKAKFDRDHVLAISKGGKTVRHNIVCACSKCNRGRGNKDWKEWFRKQPTWTQERENKIAEWIKEG